MDPDHDQGQQGDSHDDINEDRIACVDFAAIRAIFRGYFNLRACLLYVLDRTGFVTVPRSSVGSISRTIQDGLLLSERDSWNSRQFALSGENAPSNDEADTELVELTVLCAHNLKNLRFWGHMHPRAALYIDRDFTVNTAFDFRGGTNPYWNYTFWIKIDDACFQIGYLTIEIYDWNYPSRNRLIGTARMPMFDLSNSNWVRRLFSYQVQVPSGQYRGRVQVLVRRVRKAMVGTSL